ncbi:MAG: efflux RND transporter permease subunit [Acidobacteria bacterium]|nr:MAG: efflux RND transporter permease subunit [Acidobacteriota bacterium]
MVEFCIRRPVSVSMFTVAVTIFGIVSFTRLPLNLLPDISYPSLTVETRYQGAAPAEVESLVSRPIEEAVGVISGVKRLTSRSRAGTSEVTLEFLWDTNMDFAALDVREKLDLVQLPRDADKPTLLRFDPSSDPILRLGVTGSSDLAALRQYVEEELKKALDAVDGVASVKVEGGLEREIQVDVHEGRLARAGVNVAAVSAALSAGNVNLAGGSIYEEDARYLVRALNEFKDLADIGATQLVFEEGRRVYLRDVADVHWGHKERETIVRTGGHETVELRVFKEGDANTVQVARGVRERLEALDDEIPDDVAVEVLFDQSSFIEGAIDEVVENALVGGLLAVLIIALFLRDTWATVIVGLSIPVSVVATFFIMYQMGISLNIMSLGGLALGVGMLLDDSIVVIESIYRHREKGADGHDAAVRGTSEVAMAVVASTLTTVAVFLPIVFVEGVAGQLFNDQALTVSISILASLGFSLALIPVLAARLAAKRTEENEPESVPEDLTAWHRGPAKVIAFAVAGVRWIGRSFSRLVSPLTNGFHRMETAIDAAYPRACRAALKQRALVLMAVTLGFGATLLIGGRIGIELIPTLTQGEFYFDVELPEGAPLGVTDRLLETVGEEVAGFDDVAGGGRVVTTAGSFGASSVEASARGENRGRIHVVMADKDDRDAERRTIARLRETLGRFPGIAYQFDRPSYFSFKRPVELEVYSDDVEALETWASVIVEAMEAIPGLTDVRSSSEMGNPELQVFFAVDRMAQMGLSVEEVSETLRTKLRGNVATRLNEGERKIDIVVRASADARARADQVPELIVHEAEERAVPLKAVADTRLVAGPLEIRRVGQRRAVVISGNLDGRDLGSVTADIGSVIAGLSLPSSLATRFGGQQREIEDSFSSLYLAIGLAIFLVYFVMASKFESLVHPLIILFTIPLGLIGVIWALLLTRSAVSVIVLIGVVMLAGIVVKNAIVLVDYINRLREEGMAREEAIVEAGRVRLRPILMTTLTTILGLVPMALGLGEGAEIRQPMAITVIGGLAVSTLLTLIVIPVVYSVLDRKKFAS